MAIEWADILKIAASSSVATWGLNHVLVYRAALKRDARYLAHRLAIILERFSVDCAIIITDNNNYDVSGKTHAKLPTLAAFPIDSEWKAIDPALMDRVLSMPNEVAQADEVIRFRVDLEGGDEDDAQAEAQAATDDEAAQQGLKAWKLASELRCHYRIPAVKLPTDTNWNFLATLRNHSALRQSQEEERRGGPLPGFVPPA